MRSGCSIFPGTPASIALALALAACAIDGVAPAPPTPTAPARARMGANLESIEDWSRSNAFVDTIKSSRAPFGSPAAPYDGSATLGADGWPTGDFGVTVITAGQNIGGTYKLSFRGQANVSLVGTTGAVQNAAYDAASGTSSADVVVDPSSYQLMLAFRNTGGTVRDVRLIRPGYAANTTQTFTTPLLNHLARFKVLRFMDWARTNNSTVVQWLDRAQPGAPQVTWAAGVPWEYAIELSNTIGADPWINVPLSASDDYVQKLAILFKAQLNPARSIYVEFSNEVWNGSFTQFQVNYNAAVAEVAAGGSPLNADGETNTYYWAWRRTAKRSKEISDIFKSVFGTDEFVRRVRVVLAGQIAVAESFKQGLEFIERTYGPPRNYFSVVAGAPYFGMGSADSQTNLTSGQVLNALSASVDAFRDDPSLARVIELAVYHGLEPVAYEGGPDTFGPNNIAAKKAASFDPRMQNLAQRYLGEMGGRGMGLFNWYVGGATSWDTQYGTWGLTDDMANQQSPKILAIDAFLSTPPPQLTAGTAVPGEIDARLFVAVRSDPAFSAPYVRYIQPGSSFDYLVRCPSAGAYAIRVSLGTDTAGAPLDILVNGAAVQTVSAPASGAMDGGDTFADTGEVPLNLNAGLNVVRLHVPVSPSYNINSLKLYPAGASGPGPTLPMLGGLNFPWQASLLVNSSMQQSFTVNDAATPPTNLVVKATSDNQVLVPDANVVLGRSATNPRNFTFTVTPASGQVGTARITFAVTNAAGLTRTSFFDLTVHL